MPFLRVMSRFAMLYVREYLTTDAIYVGIALVLPSPLDRCRWYVAFICHYATAFSSGRVGFASLVRWFVCGHGTVIFPVIRQSDSGIKR